jgi:hypothetical protein
MNKQGLRKYPARYCEGDKKMGKKRVMIFIASEPKYDEFAFKYFILNLNKIQDSFEFHFPISKEMIFSKTKKLITK